MESPVESTHELGNRPRAAPNDVTEASYDRFAAAYRDWWAPVIAPAAVLLLDRLGGQVPAHESTIVDIGTGTGTLAVAALSRWSNARVIGVDPSRRMLELAEAAARETSVADRLQTEVGEAGRLPIADGSADAAMSSFVLHLVPNRAAAVREAHRVLRPGGAFASLVWRADNEPWEPRTVFEEALEELDIDAPDPPGGGRPYASPSSAAAELRRAGFRSVRAREEWLEHRFTPASYVDLLEHWIEDDTFATQEEPMRLRLRAATLRRLERLEPDALVWRRPLVSVVGLRDAADRPQRPRSA